MKRAEILLVALLAMVASACAQHTTYLECGTVIDEKAVKPLGPTRIAIQNGKIVSIEEHRPNIGLGVGSGTIETIDIRYDYWMS